MSTSEITLFRVIDQATREVIKGEFAITPAGELLSIAEVPQSVSIQLYAGVSDSEGTPIFFGSTVEVSNGQAAELKKLRTYEVIEHSDADHLRALLNSNRGIVVRVVS